MGISRRRSRGSVAPVRHRLRRSLLTVSSDGGSVASAPTIPSTDATGRYFWCSCDYRFDVGASRPEACPRCGRGMAGLLADGEFVSCNALDTALALTNRLPFGERIVKFARSHIWHELMVRYLSQDNLSRVLKRLMDGEQAGHRELAGG
jgi:hypothetical protein